MADAGFQAATEWDSVQMWRAGPTSQKSIGVVRHTSGLQKKDLTVLSTDPEKASGPRAPIRDHLSLQSRNGPELPRLGKKKKKATRGSATNTLNCEKWTLCPKGDKRGKNAPCPLLAPMPQPSGPCRETSKRKAAEWGGGSDLLVLRGHDCVEDAKHLTKTVKTKTKPPRGEPGRRTQA